LFSRPDEEAGVDRKNSQWIVPLYRCGSEAMRLVLVAERLLDFWVEAVGCNPNLKALEGL